MPAENPAADVVNDQTEDEKNDDMSQVGEFTDLMSKDNPTDMGHFGDVVNDELEQFVVDYGTCRPRGPFPKDESQESRSFSGAYHYMVSLKLAYPSKFPGLAYSLILDSAYCEPRWLFADRTDPHYNRAWSTCENGNRLKKI